MASNRGNCGKTSLLCKRAAAISTGHHPTRAVLVARCPRGYAHSSPSRVRVLPKRVPNTVGVVIRAAYGTLLNSCHCAYDTNSAADVELFAVFVSHFSASHCVT
jgi:hypothetical protein